MASSGGVVGTGGDREGTNCLRSPPLICHLLQVPGESSPDGRQLLAGSAMQPLARKSEVGTAYLVTEQGVRG